MVIYLRKGMEIIVKVLVVFTILLFFYGVTYFVSFIKYNNRVDIEKDYIVLENQELKKELKKLSDIEYKEGVISKVIIRDLYSFYDEVLLNVGEDKVNEKDVVIVEDSLIGIIDKVNKNTSNVKLLSSNFNISVKINDVYGNFNNGIVTMIDKYSDIKKGDLVYTSGLDEVLGDIYIGKVSKVSEDKENLGLIVEVKYKDNYDLNYVIVKGKLT